MTEILKTHFQLNYCIVSNLRLSFQLFVLLCRDGDGFLSHKPSICPHHLNMFAYPWRSSHNHRLIKNLRDYTLMAKAWKRSWLSKVRGHLRSKTGGMLATFGGSAPEPFSPLAYHWKKISCSNPPVTDRWYAKVSNSSQKTDEQDTINLPIYSYQMIKQGKLTHYTLEPIAPRLP